jgi:hypothetical protein
LKHFVYNETQDADDQKDLGELLGLVNAGHLHVEIGSQASWSKTASALSSMKNRQLRGKAVLFIDNA